MPDVFMIGGTNGSGKTTAAMTLLPRYLDIFEFVNADEIARGLNPLKPVLDNSNLALRQLKVIAEKKVEGNVEVCIPEIWRRIIAAKEES